MEYAHRMWGRMVGMAFLVPAGFFLYKGWISKALKPRLLVFTGLLGFQVLPYGLYKFFLLQGILLGPRKMRVPYSDRCVRPSIRVSVRPCICPSS